MKRYGDLFHLIVDEENLENAIYNAASGKCSLEKPIEETTKEIYDVLLEPKLHVQRLKELLTSKTFKCSPYEVFTKNDKGKLREIYKLPFFPDRVIQHAILQVIEPIWKKTLISHTFQSIQGRGVHLCLKHVVKAVQVDGMNYCLQLDVRKFYPSINNFILKEVVRRKLKCPDTIHLIDTIIDGMEGVPIGNYISQYLANLYLSELDHKIKEVLKLKYYYRYCDDLIILSNSKQELWEAFDFIRVELTKILLDVKGNYQLYEINKVRGVNCFGYLVHPDSVRIRTSIATNFSRSLRDMRKKGFFNPDSVSSYFGWFKHCDGAALWKSITKDLWPVGSPEQEFLNSLGAKLYEIRDQRRRATRNSKTARESTS